MPHRESPCDCAGIPLAGRANHGHCGARGTGAAPRAARGAAPTVPTAVGVVCHANRCVLADPDGDESPATAVAGLGTAVPVVCHPTAVGGEGPQAQAWR
jgi:hypothetical protein